MRTIDSIVDRFNVKSLHFFSNILAFMDAEVVHEKHQLAFSISFPQDLKEVEKIFLFDWLVVDVDNFVANFFGDDTNHCFVVNVVVSLSNDCVVTLRTPISFLDCCFCEHDLITVHNFELKTPSNLKLIKCNFGFGFYLFPFVFGRKLLDSN